MTEPSPQNVLDAVAALDRIAVPALGRTVMATRAQAKKLGLTLVEIELAAQNWKNNDLHATFYVVD